MYVYFFLFPTQLKLFTVACNNSNRMPCIKYSCIEIQTISNVRLLTFLLREREETHKTVSAQIWHRRCQRDSDGIAGNKKID